MLETVSRVTDPHPSLLEFEPVWERIQAALGGSDAVKAANLLPQIPAHRQDSRARSAYTERALWYGATARTVDALVGASHRRESAISVPRRYAPRLDDITNAGESFHNFAKRVTRQVLSYGRYGLLVDVASVGNHLDPLDRLPFLQTYPAQSIRNWRYRVQGGRPVLEQIVLREAFTIPTQFGSVSHPQYRVIELDPDYGHVIVRTFRSVQGTGEFVEVDTDVPTNFRGDPLGTIPFIIVGPNGTGPDVQRSPIADLVDVNLAHFRNSADYENALFLLGQPTVSVIGGPDDMDTVRLGGSIFLPSGASIELLEYRGDGLGYMERALQSKEALMATLGARLLESPKRAAETAEAVKLRQYGDTSTLASVARSVSDGIEEALKMACAWDNIEGPISVELNQDFFDATMEPAFLAELVRTVQAGLLPVDDFILQLQKGEIIRQNLTIEEVRGLLDTDRPPLGGRPVSLDDPANEPGKPAAPAPSEVAA
jgi:hypothetical protein